MERQSPDPSPRARSSEHLATFRNFTYDLVLWLFNIILDLFFREIHPRSSWRVPRQGPVLFVAAPHANQFVDPLILMRLIRKEAHRRVAFLIAESSMKRKVIGLGARMVGAVPVGRAMDNKILVPGKICLPDPDNDPLLIRGDGTNFETKDFQVGGQLVLPTVNKAAASAEILEIVGPEEIRLKKPFSGSIAFNQLTGRARVLADGQKEDDLEKEFDGTPFKVTPKIDQSRVYNAVFQRLNDQECVGIFPEGGSHDRTELLPLKAGVAIMALGSLALNPDSGLTIVPCGMNYFHAHRFRSRCVVEFGAPVSVRPEFVELYRNGERREAIGQLLTDIHQALLSVTVNAPDYDTLMLIQAVRRLYNHDNKKLPLGLVVELNRRLVKGYERYKNDPRIVSLKRAVLDYNKQLLELQIRDHQVDYARLPRLKVLWLLCQRICQISLLSLGVLPGLILFSPVFVAGKLISIKKSKEALAASTVKINANDVMATWKLLVSLALAPALYMFYTVVLVTLTYENRAFGLVPGWVPLWLVVLGGFIFFPLITYAALRFGEVGMDIVKSLPPLFAALSPWHGRILARLRRRRAQLVDEVTTLINELGPELYPDFEKVRIIPESGDAYFDMKPLRRGTNASDDGLAFGRARQDSGASGGSEPGSPATPYGYDPGKLPRNESFQNLANIGFFASRPATPHHHPRARSRNNSVPALAGLAAGAGGGGAGGLLGFSPLESHDSMEEISKKIRGAMRERSAKRRNTTGGVGPGGSVGRAETGSAAWEESEASTPASEDEAVSMAKKDD